MFRLITTSRYRALLASSKHATDRKILDSVLHRCPTAFETAAQRDLARDVAVQLEQENAELTEQIAELRDAADKPTDLEIDLAGCLDRMTAERDRYQKLLNRFPDAEQVAALQAANEAMDVPIGLDVTAKDWRAAVVCVIAAIAAKKAGPTSAVTA